jgi:tetratricopeptide (TPR) repeat protein
MRPLVFILLNIVFSGLLQGQNPSYPVQSAQPYNALQDHPVERSMNNLPILSEPRSILETAMGWTLQDDGKWISKENRLLYSKAEYNSSGKTYYKLGKENFEVIEMRDVSYKNEQYAVLVIKFRTGYYEFPILMDSWHNQQALSYFVFKADKLKEVIPEKMEFNKPYITNMEVVCDGTLLEYDKNTWTTTISYFLQKTLSDKTFASHNLLIAFWPVQTGGQSLARFRLIQVMNKAKFYTPYLELKNRDKLFRSSYYETEFSLFQDLMRYSGSIPFQLFTGNPQTPDEFYKRGVSNYGTENYSQCVYDMTEAAKAQPYVDFFLTYAYRANARQKLGDFALAMQDFDKAVNLKPADLTYYSAWLTTIYNRGVARQNMKDINGACQDWNTAVQLGFKDLATDNAIKEYCKNYRYTVPSVNFNAVSQAAPGSSPPEMQTDYYKVYWDGVWKYENGNYAEAIRYFNRALQLQPQTNVVGIYSYRGNCKLKLTDYAGAIMDFDYAIGFSASQPTESSTMKSIYYNRGLSNFFLGNAAIACSDFQKSLNAGMSDPQSLIFIKQVCK